MSMMNAESTPSSPPPPMIGKIGPYTVFVTPPPTPKPNASTPHSLHNSPLSSSIPRRVESRSSPPLQSQSPPPVLPPPVHYSPKDNASSFAFFWDAVAKVQHAHSSLDGYVAHWFGLNQSKYQWALDDYYESKGGLDQVDGKVKDIARKTESV